MKRPNIKDYVEYTPHNWDLSRIEKHNCELMSYTYAIEDYCDYLEKKIKNIDEKNS